jgi:hypothetical protein
MESNDRLLLNSSNDIQNFTRRKISRNKQKKVTFVSDVKEYIRDPSNSQKAKKAPNYPRMRNTIIHFMVQNNCPDLERYFDSLEKQTIDELFLTYGKMILSSALTDPHAETFECLLNKVALHILQQILEGEGFKLLEDFLYLEQCSEKRGYYSEDRKSVRIKKFVIFLEIDAKGVQGFLNEKTAQKYITDNIRKDFETALSLIQELA